MSDLLGIGYSGLKAYSRALSTIGDNIANAQTPGYARRRLEMMEAVGGGNSIFYRGNTNPGGVDIRGLDRSVDGWLIEDSRITSGGAERSATKLNWLDKVEGALSDETNGIKTGLTKLYTTADQLTSDPSNRTLRAQFLRGRGIGHARLDKIGQRRFVQLLQLASAAAAKVLAHGGHVVWSRLQGAIGQQQVAGRGAPRKAP